MLNDVRWYIRRGGNRKNVRDIVSIWIRFMMPITPHIAEELWERMGFGGLVSS